MRGETFVSRKITRAVAAIELGLQHCLFLGNLDAVRDWGHARDYVEGMWLMLQQNTPGDYVLATGKEHSVRDFAELSFRQVGRDIEWKGVGTDEMGIDSVSGEVLVRVDPQYFRPAEVDCLLGDPKRAKDCLGWEHKTSFLEMVAEMVASDLDLVRRERRVNVE